MSTYLTPPELAKRWRVKLVERAAWDREVGDSNSSAATFVRLRQIETRGGDLVSGVFLTRDKYQCELPYSIWTTRPGKDQYGYWIRSDPKAQNCQSLLTAECGAQLAGRDLALGDITFLPDLGSR